jgi:predicted alpha/beta superfamily hydrolase
MTRLTPFFFCAALILFLNGCSGGDATPEAAHAEVQPDEPTAVTISGTDRHLLYSKEIDQTFEIDVAMPYSLPAGKLPVVYVTDGGSMFPLVTISAMLLQLGFELPPMIIVGIGYKVDTPREALSLRTRDLTPAVDEAFLAEQSAGPDGLSPGGADAFLDFIEEQVKPMIRANYPASDDETLVGDSLGGLFALHALFTRTDDYDRYLVGSPSIWWDNQSLFETEAAYANNHEDLDADVFISVGALEEGVNPELDSAKMVSNSVEMAARLRAHDYPSLRLTEHVFEGETHLSVIPATMSRGLRALFAEEAEALQAASQADRASTEDD